MEDWGALKARLENTAGVYSNNFGMVNSSDIRAALERVEDLADQVDYWMGKELALRHRVEELEQTAARIASEAACERLRAEAAEAKLKMAQDQAAEIAASNVDHVRWHREMEAKLAKVVGVLSAVSLHDDTESICLRALAAAKGEPANGPSYPWAMEKGE